MQRPKQYVLVRLNMVNIEHFKVMEREQVWSSEEYMKNVLTEMNMNRVQYMEDALYEIDGGKHIGAWFDRWFCKPFSVWKGDFLMDAIDEFNNGANSLSHYVWDSLSNAIYWANGGSEAEAMEESYGEVIADYLKRNKVCVGMVGGEWADRSLTKDELKKLILKYEKEMVDKSDKWLRKYYASVGGRLMEWIYTESKEKLPCPGLWCDYEYAERIQAVIDKEQN